MINSLLAEIRAHGDRGAVVPFARFDDLKKDILALGDGAFHTTWIDRMVKYMADGEDKRIPSDEGFTPRSLICVVMPSPKVELEFSYRGKPVQCVLPPLYTNEREKNERAQQYINAYLAPLGFSAEMMVMLPQKMLAVHSGLGRYGRNNICYNDEFGSYMQIMTYVSDMPCDDGAWFPLSRMASCETCRACVAACPTGAIDADRQLIDSDRCITLYNESPENFPEWMDKRAHNSLVGCTRCQDCCPGNARNRDNCVMGVAFTEEETAQILAHVGDTPYTDSLAAKIEATGIAPYYAAFLPRNLAALLER